MAKQPVTTEKNNKANSNNKNNRNNKKQQEQQSHKFIQLFQFIIRFGQIGKISAPAGALHL